MTEKLLLIDTAYVYAIINPRDHWHARAVGWQKIITAENLPLLTTEFILAEIADGLASIKFRQAAVKAIRILQENPLVKIIPASADLFEKSLKLYEQRHDKNWGLTDCASFVVMNENDLTDALTTDEHFRQAGFQALMLD